jgi:phage terminase small subunit
MQTTLIPETNIIKSTILTDKETKFIQEYLVDGNGTRAVLEAGYKTKAPSAYV